MNASKWVSFALMLASAPDVRTVKSNLTITASPPRRGLDIIITDQFTILPNEFLIYEPTFIETLRCLMDVKAHRLVLSLEFL